MALNLGGIIRLTYTVKTDVGVPVNPSTATLTIIQPDGTLATPTVTLPPVVTGTLSVDFTPTQAGLHSVQWQSAVPGTAEPDVFVAERPASLLISVDEAVNHLRAAGVITSDADREELQWRCLVASEAVERDLNRIMVRRTFTETYDGNTVEIRLRQYPLISVTTVVESGVTLPTTGAYFLNPSTGLLYRGTTTTGYWWAYGRQNVTVTYVAGYSDPPRSVREVALGTVQELWQSSQQAAHPLINEEAELAVASAVSALPGPLRGAYNRLRTTGVA